MFHRKLEFLTFIFVCAVIQGLELLGAHLRIVGLQFLNWFCANLRIVGLQFLHWLGANVRTIGSNCKQLVTNHLAAFIEVDVMFCTNTRFSGLKGCSSDPISVEEDESSSESEAKWMAKRMAKWMAKKTKRPSKGTSATGIETDSEVQSGFIEEENECQFAGNGTKRVDSLIRASLETEVRVFMSCCSLFCRWCTSV